MGLTFSSFPRLAASLLSPCVVWLQILTHLRSGRHFEVFEVKKKKKKKASLTSHSVGALG